VRSSSWSRVLIVAAAMSLIGAVAASSVPAGAATAARAPAHPIRPGTAVTMSGITCTAGAVLRQKATVYVAIPASCAGVAPGTYQDGCSEPEAPTGTPARVVGARHRAILVYDSFTRMEKLGTAQVHTTAGHRLCHYNDLALVQLNKHDRARVAGAIDGMRAPTSVRQHGPASGRRMTIGRGAATAGASHQGGWVYDVTPSASLVATDVGSAGVVGGKELGMLTVLPAGTLSTLPFGTPVTSPAQVYNLHKALLFLRKAPGFHHVTLLAAGERP
jgi:hypothetical protein